MDNTLTTKVPSRRVKTTMAELIDFEFGCVASLGGICQDVQLWADAERREVYFIVAPTEGSREMMRRWAEGEHDFQQFELDSGDKGADQYYALFEALWVWWGEAFREDTR